MIIPVLEGLTLSKGHAAGCDLIIVPDVDGHRTLSEAEIGKICDRRTGIGASGLLRATRVDGHWVADMGQDRRILPGDLAVYAHYLNLSGLVDLPVGASIEIVTNEGVFTVVHDEDGYTIPVAANIRGGSQAVADGFDRAVGVSGIEGQRGGLTIDTPSPFVVTVVSHEEEMEGVDLSHVSFDPPTLADLVVVMPEGEHKGRSNNAVTDFDMVTRGDEIESAIASSRALHAWSGAPSGTYRTGSIVTRIDQTMTVTVPAEIVAEFQLAGLVGEF